MNKIVSEHNITINPPNVKDFNNIDYPACQKYDQLSIRELVDLLPNIDSVRYSWLAHKVERIILSKLRDMFPEKECWQEFVGSVFNEVD